MTSYAAGERAALSDLLDRVGAEAPTLCEGWAARDLTAHLVLRERRPDALVGAVAGPLAGRARKVQDEVKGKPWPELVGLFRAGPPRWSPASLPGADELANAIEFFVHHEDLRRAQGGWAPRPLEPEFQDLLWKRLRVLGRLLYRRARVGVVLHRAGSAESLTARKGSPEVTVTGSPGELLMHAFGRTAHARVNVEGDTEAVRIFATTPLGA